MPINIDALLQPIPGADPCGSDLRYQPVTPLIKEARREESEMNQGVWKHDVKVADFPQVVKLSREALTKQGKDLQVAAWLTEALLRLEGFAGLRQGLELIRRMLETYWDGVHPLPDDDGDLEMRATPLRWVGTQLDNGIRSAPITKGGHNWYQYRESRTVPTEEEALSGGPKQLARAEALEEGKTTPEDFERGFAATPGAWCLEFYKSIESLLETVKSLGAYCDEKFGDSAPEFSLLTKSLEEIFQTARVLMKLKGVSDEPPPDETGYEPPPPPEQPPAAAMVGPEYTPPPAPPPPPPPPAAPRPATGSVWAEPLSREDAASRVAAAARYLRKENPLNAAGYMVTRALRWGELRATGTRPHPRILLAPPSEVRVNLKQMAADGNWAQALEAAEEAAGEPYGRAWLDLHRYSATAMQVNGLEVPMRALLSGLKALLADMPQLLEWSLADDTPLANAETVAWLKEQNLLPGAEPAPAAVAPEPPPPPPPPVEQPAWYPPPSAAAEQSGEPQPPDPYDLAMEAARSGRIEEAFHILSQEVNQENSGRGRFLRRIQLAQVCLATGNKEIGRPILQELAEEIERRVLADWESADMVAQPLALLYRCLDDAQDATGEKRKLYARICRLDPSRALGLR